MIPDETIKTDIANQHDYAEWNKSIVNLEDLKSSSHKDEINENLISRMRAFGYTTETMQFMLLPCFRIERSAWLYG